MSYKEALVGLLVILMLPVIWAFIPRHHGEVMYNCSLVEISPDIPVEVKEQCRKLRMEKVK